MGKNKPAGSVRQVINGWNLAVLVKASRIPAAKRMTVARDEYVVIA